MHGHTNIKSKRGRLRPLIYLTEWGGGGGGGDGGGMGQKKGTFPGKKKKKKKTQSLPINLEKKD